MCVGNEHLNVKINLNRKDLLVAFYQPSLSSKLENTLVLEQSSELFLSDLLGKRLIDSTCFLSHPKGQNKSPKLFSNFNS